MKYLDETGLSTLWSKIKTNFPKLENDKIPSTYLPSYVDDVLEYTNKSSFPTTGEEGKIYVAKDTNIIYRWSGSAYIEISASLALGTTSSTAYRGDLGAAATAQAATNKTNIANLTTNKVDKASFGTPQSIVQVQIVNPVWTVYKNDGTTQVKTMSATSITLEMGYKAKFSGNFKWTAESGKISPSSTSGSWGTTLPASGANSTTLTTAVYGSATTGSQTISGVREPAAKVENGYVVLETGTPTVSSTAKFSLSYNYNVFTGATTSQSLSGTDFANLTAAAATGKGKTVSGVTTTSSQYYVYAYPKAWGTLSKIIQNGATPILDAFNVSTVSYTNGAGYAQDYYVYISANPGAFTNAQIAFS